jgi:hypothetical protein
MFISSRQMHLARDVCDRIITHVFMIGGTTVGGKLVTLQAAHTSLSKRMLHGLSVIPVGQLAL